MSETTPAIPGATTLGHDDARPAKPEGSSLFRVLRFLRPYAAHFALLLLLTAAFSGTQYARAYLMKPIFDDVLLPQSKLAEEGAPPGWLEGVPIFGKQIEKAGGEVDPATPESIAEREALGRNVMKNLWQIVLAGVGLVIALPILMYYRNYLMLWILGRIYTDVVRVVCERLLMLPLGYHHDTSRGDVLSRALNDVKNANNAIELVIDELIQSVLMIAIGVGVMLFISWQLALVAVALAPIIFGVVAMFNTRIRHAARKRQEKIGDVTGHLVEILDGIKIIKAFQTEEVENRAFRKQTRKLFRRTIQAAKNRILARAFVVAMINFLTITMLILGVMMVLSVRFAITAGDLAAFALVLSTTYAPVRGLAKTWVKLMDAEPSADRFCAILDAAPEIPDPPDAVSISGLREHIELRDVSFSYGREPVLGGVSFDVRAGEVVALVGRTGAGKTTIADLLMRFHEPDSGSIEIDGVDIRNIRRESLLAQIGVVTQDPFLFDGTILDNIRYGRMTATEDEIFAAARAAHVDEFVDTLPDGYATDVGTDGVRLSGGQRQRITIARALLKNPAILIFDEATSALDSKSERFVQDAIESLLGGRTVFMIAHRLSTIRRANKIVVIDGGQVVQSGTHEELSNVPGLYREFVDVQSMLELTPGLDDGFDEDEDERA